MRGALLPIMFLASLPLTTVARAEPARSRLSPKSSALVKQAQEALLDGQYQQAIKLAGELPAHTEALLLHALAEIGANNVDAARRDIEKILTMEPTHDR